VFSIVRVPPRSYATKIDSFLAGRDLKISRSVDAYFLVARWRPATYIVFELPICYRHVCEIV
jgi:hypothetical protein